MLYLTISTYKWCRSDQPHDEPNGVNLRASSAANMRSIPGASALRRPCWLSPIYAPSLITANLYPSVAFVHSSRRVKVHAGLLGRHCAAIGAQLWPLALW